MVVNNIIVLFNLYWKQTKILLFSKVSLASLASILFTCIYTKNQFIYSFLPLSPLIIPRSVVDNKGAGKPGSPRSPLGPVKPGGP